MTPMSWHGKTHDVRYISDGTWFDEGTEALCVTDCRPEGQDIGLFEGVRHGEVDQEVCGFDEFYKLGHHSE